MQLYGAVEMILDKEKYSKSSREYVVRIPRTESISVNNIGVFEDKLKIHFSPRINIIKSPCGTGKSTLLGCLKAAYYLGIEYTRTAYIPDDADIRIKVAPYNGMIESRLKGTIRRTIDSLRKEKMKVVSGPYVRYPDDHDIWSRLKVFKDKYIRKENLHRFDQLSKGERDYIDFIFQTAMTMPNECYIKDDFFRTFDRDMVKKVLNILLEQGFQSIFTTNRDIEERNGVNLIQLEKETLLNFWQRMTERDG